VTRFTPGDSLPPGDFRLLIAAINRGAVRDIEDEATRIARAEIRKRKSHICASKRLAAVDPTVRR
jgi:hypothetical protein